MADYTISAQDKCVYSTVNMGTFKLIVVVIEHNFGKTLNGDRVRVDGSVLKTLLRPFVGKTITCSQGLVRISGMTNYNPLGFYNQTLDFGDYGRYTLTVSVASQGGFFTSRLINRSTSAIFNIVGTMTGGNNGYNMSPFILIRNTYTGKCVCGSSITANTTALTTENPGFINLNNVPFSLIPDVDAFIFPSYFYVNSCSEAALPVDEVDYDPYAPGGYSGTGGGGGTFDLESDVIGLPPIPTLSFAATGFTRIYNPTLAELNSLANYLWTDQTFLDTVINHLKQLLENPMDAVISLSLLPCSIPNGTPEAVKVMYINTGVSMAPATTQFVDVDCGTYTIEEFYGSALDYNPYTKVHCYLPYIGQVTLDTDEVMGKTLNVVYRIDIVTGMCAAMILVDQNVLYQFSGHCAINMPINSADFSGYIGAAMTAGKMVAGIAAGAAGLTPLAAELVGAPTPHATTTHTMDTTRSTDLIRNEDTHRQTERRSRTVTSPEVSFGELARKSVANSVGAVMGSKVSIQHAGGFTGNSGYLAVRRPYLIIERPRMCNPEEYGKYNGRPSMIYMNLGECEGYTEVQSIQFENIPATNPELAELSELLKSGVLF